MQNFQFELKVEILETAILENLKDAQLMKTNEDVTLLLQASEKDQSKVVLFLPDRCTNTC